MSSGWQRRDLIALIAATVVINLIVLAIPLYINRIYTSVVPEQAGDSLVGTTLLLAAVLVLDVVIKGIRAWVLSWLAASSEHRLRMAAVRAVLGASSKAVSEQPLKARMAQLRSPTSLRNFLEQQWIVRYVDLPFSLVYLIVLATIGGWLFLPPLLLAPVFVVLAKLSVREIIQSTHRYHDLEVGRNQLVVNGLGMSSTIKTLNIEGYLIRRFEPLQELLSQSTFQKESSTTRLQNLSALFSQLNQLLIVTLGGWLVINQDLTTGALAACTLLSGQVAAPLGKFFSADGQKATYKQSTLDLQQLLDLPQENNLLVGYDERPTDTTLHFAGYALRPSETIVLLGGQPGQSTALFDAIEAETIDSPYELRVGTELISTFRKTWLRRHLVRLNVDPQPFRGTLLETLTGFDVNSRSAEAISLCELHGVGSSIKTLPMGYDTIIGETQDYPLTSGLRFRLGVMQALLEKPFALYLDGTFPNIDNESLEWFLGLDVDCARLIALQSAPSQLPSSIRRLCWNGGHLVEVQP